MRTDLVCKGNCPYGKMGKDDEGDHLDDGGELYDDLEGEEFNKIDIVDFEIRWRLKLRLIPNILDSSYEYYDPNDIDSSTPLKDKAVINIVNSRRNSTGSSSNVLLRSASPSGSRATDDGISDQEVDYYDDSDSDSEDEYGCFSSEGKLC